MRVPIVTLAALCLGLASTRDAAAQPTSTGSISLQGKLSGISDGTRQLTFFLHDAEFGGNQLANVGPIAATITGGVFSSNIAVPPSTFDGRTLWWSVSVDAGPESARQMVTSVPYAATANRLVSTDQEMLLNAATIRCSAILKTQCISASDFALEVVNTSGGGGISIATTTGGSLPPLTISYAGQPRFKVFGSGDTQNFGFFRNESSSTQRYSLEVVNTSGAGGLTVSTTPGGGLDPIAVFHAGQRQFTVLQDGKTQLRTLQILGGSDLAEPFTASPMASQAVEPRPGMVLSIDPENPGALRVTSSAYDTRVAGVYSGANGLPTGMIMGKEDCDLTAPGNDKLPLAMTGRVWVYADDSSGAIQPGDRLTTSGSQPGHAMKVTDEARSIGAVIGKAMTPIDPETGMVLVLVNLQ